MLATLHNRDLQKAVNFVASRACIELVLHYKRLLKASVSTVKFIQTHEAVNHFEIS